MRRGKIARVLPSAHAVYIRLCERGKIGMNKVKNTIKWLCNIYEIYFSSILVIGVLLLFCAQVAVRYVFKGNTFYIYELSIICFGWTSIIGASYSFRREREYGDGHVKFSILADILKGKDRLWLDVILSVIIIISMAIMILPTIDTIGAYHISKTNVVRLPFSVFYFPFLVCIFLTMLHEISNLVYSLRSIFSSSGESKDTNASLDEK